MLLLLFAACSDTGLSKADPEAPTTSDEAGPAGCPAYTGFRTVGQTWTWALSGGLYDAVTVYTLTALEGDRAVVEMRSTAEGEDFTGTWTRVSNWRCDEVGAWLVDEEVDTYQESTGAYPYTIDDLMTFTYAPEGWLIVPRGLDSGSTWDVAFTLETTSDTWGDSAQDWEGTYFAENEEEIEVPAGTFTTMEINGAGEILDSGGATWTDHDYRDAEVGLVFDDTTAALTAWTE